MDEKIIGKTFGRLYVREFSHSDAKYGRYYVCLCDCGNVKNVPGKLLLNGHVKSCGCLLKENAINLKGESFGALLVLERNGTAPNKHALWKCLCNCGRIVNVESYRLINGSKIDCGKHRKEKNEKKRIREGIF